MAIANLGRVGLVLKGDWVSTEDYVPMDLVSHDGKAWAAKRNNKNVEPNTSATDDWQLISDNTDLVSTVLGYKNDAADSATAAAASATAAATSASSGPNALENIQEYNAYNVLTGLLTETTATTNQVTFTWTDDTCNVNGTASADTLHTVYQDTLPASVVPGRWYYAKYSTEDANVRLQIVFRDTNDADISSVVIRDGKDQAFMVPSGTVKWRIGLFVASGTTIDHAEVSEIAILNAEENSALNVRSLGGKYVAFGDALSLGSVWNTANDGTASHRCKEEWRIPARIARAIGAQNNFANEAVGGIGYVTKATIGGNQKNIVDLVKAYDFSGVELATFMAGPSDAAVTLGFSDSEAGDGSLCGAIREIIDYMRTNYPKVELIFIQSTPYVGPDKDVWAGRGVWSLNDFDKQVSRLCWDQHVGYVSWYGCSYVAKWNILNAGYVSSVGPRYTFPVDDFDYCVIGDYIAGKIAQMGQNNRPEKLYDTRSYGYDDMTHGSYLKMTGDSLAFNPYARAVADANYSSIFIPVRKGDSVYLKTVAGSSNAFPYAVIIHSYLISSVYDSGAYFNGTISITADGFLAVNMLESYKNKFICEVTWDITDSARRDVFLDALPMQSKRMLPEYDDDNVCKAVKTGPSLMGMIQHWAIIGASYDSGEFNFRVNNSEHVSEVDWFAYSCWDYLKRINGIPDMYNYSNGGQNARDWIALDDGATTLPWISREGNISRSHAYNSDTEVTLWYWDYPTNTVPGRSGIGTGGGCWWKMLADHNNGDTKQAFVINLGSNDINKNYPFKDDDQDAIDPNYDPANPNGKYLCGTTDDIGTYNLSTNSDTVPSSGTPSTTTEVISGIYNSYCAYIGAILNRILAIQPDAIIFLCTIRNGFYKNSYKKGVWEQYNTALKAIAALDAYKDNVFILDMGAYGPCYAAAPMSSSIVYAHPNAFGYQFLAGYWNTLIDHAIQKNYTKMTQSMFIGTGKSYTPLSE